MESILFRWLTLTAVIYFLIAKFGMAVLSLEPSNVTLLWLPSGIGLIMCLKAGWRALPWIFVASFSANFSGMAHSLNEASLLHTTIAAMSDAGSVYLASILLTKRFPSGLNNPTNLLEFCIYVCLIPSGLGSLILTLNLVSGHYIDPSNAYVFFVDFIISDTLGILLIYPLYISWGATPIHLKNLTPTIVLFFIASLTLTYLAFTYQSGLIYLIPPLLALMAYYKEERCLHILSLVSVVFLMMMANDNFGPFALSDPNQSISALSLFVFSMIILPYSIQLHARELQTASNERDDWMIRASLDALTGLTNRYGFMPKMEKEYHRARRYQHPFVFVMVDIDHFKKINDKYGHLVGDEVLKQMAGIFRRELRDSDYICRFGGEEFALLLPETDINHAIPVLERLRKTFENKVFDINELGIQFTISLGAIEYHGEDTPMHEILDIGDKRLYKAKEQGRNRLVFQD